MKIQKISVYMLLAGVLLQPNFFFSQEASSSAIDPKSAIVLAGASFYVYHKYLSRPKRFERSLRNEYAQKFNAFKNTFKFTDKEWKETITLINQAKKYTKNNTYRSHKIKVSHDLSLEKEIIDTAKTYLKKYNINPNCVHIKKLPKTNRASGMAELHLAFSWKVINGNKKNITFKTKKAPTIYLREDLSSLSKKEQRATIAHEVTHLVEQHSTESIILELQLKEKGYDASTIENNPAWQNYLEAAEKCADLLPCMHDSITAQNVFTRLEYQCHNNNPHAKIKTSVHPTRWSQYQWMKNYMQVT